MSHDSPLASLDWTLRLQTLRQQSQTLVCSHHRFIVSRHLEIGVSNYNLSIQDRGGHWLETTARRLFLYYLEQQHHYHPPTRNFSRDIHIPHSYQRSRSPRGKTFPLTRNTAKFPTRHIDSSLVFYSHLFLILFLFRFMSISLHSFPEREIFNHSTISVLYYPSLLFHTLCICEATRIGSKGRFPVG
ncbi:hypothetical protein BDP55DRAFT_260237 [Colletotrichum godetiae]|uniref:Uncharacterized protein n=1 Tax=Colletotrichum godetiae TaxID=1209918 RepID=A0AAJ0AVT8_9PEZI|nr:uncharacterized protein BDP55DRAFT_260237 [Colletotrichum godetiae]KAK1691297.1 hypothetical protein BDP55DRAFT_260237 [Colletotrichum godetiae]